MLSGRRRKADDPQRLDQLLLESALGWSFLSSGVFEPEFDSPNSVLPTATMSGEVAGGGLRRHEPEVPAVLSRSFEHLLPEASRK